MLTLFFTKKDQPVRNFDDAAACDLKKFSKYFSSDAQARASICRLPSLRRSLWGSDPYEAPI